MVNLRRAMNRSAFVPVAAAAVLLTGCGQNEEDVVRISYWEKWTGKEGEAMQRCVDQFNRLGILNKEGKRIVVEYLNISNVDRKTIVATAGGDPPDVAGLWVFNIYSFADRNALMPLDDFIRREGQTPEQWLSRYYPVYADMCTYRGRTWALPTTPTTYALYWNKAMFRAAALDPDRPPRTVQELDEFAAKLAKTDASGRIVQLGFLPQEPGWAAWSFPQWFGGQLWDGENILIGAHPANLEAYRWVEKYSRQYGLEQIKAFVSGFGNFSSPQNPFFSGKIAMVYQGVWLNNYMKQYAPGMEYGCAPWPVARAGLENFTVADADVIMIPSGSKHPEEAWEFIKYISSINAGAQTEEELFGMELLCWGQEKNSPMRLWSPQFEKRHPHPYIGVFRQLAESPNAIHVPKIGIWQEYSREIGSVFENVRLLNKSPEEALAFAQKRVSESWTLHQRSLARRNRTRKNSLSSKSAEETPGVWNLGFAPTPSQRRHRCQDKPS